MNILTRVSRRIGDGLLAKLAAPSTAAANACTWTQSNQICDYKCTPPVGVVYVRYLMVGDQAGCADYCGADWHQNGRCPY